MNASSNPTNSRVDVRQQLREHVDQLTAALNTWFDAGFGHRGDPAVNTAVLDAYRTIGPLLGILIDLRSAVELELDARQDPSARSDEPERPGGSKAYEYDKGYEDGWEARDNELRQSVDSRHFDTTPGAGRVLDGAPESEHRPWCTQHEDGGDDPNDDGEVDICTDIVTPVPGLLLSMSQDREQAEPVIEIERTGSGPGEMTLAQAEMVFEALATMLHGGSASVRRSGGPDDPGQPEHRPGG